ncbi:MAG: hypothetical protein Q8M54_01520 [Desulfobaccales bacterium]|nr:hypothetical protein [Desulfobaccales bacterium]
MSDLVCYCFQYTAKDIEKDVRQHNGMSMILERIMAEKKKNACQCNLKHPLGK